MRRSLLFATCAGSIAIGVACGASDDTPQPMSTASGQDASIAPPPIEAEDANVGDATTNFACSADTECPAGQRCAYLVTLACSAQGACVVPAPPITDGASLIACARNGTDVDYVTPLATSLPASSPSPCTDGAVAIDASFDARDASLDAAAD